jgi:adenylate kinase
MGVAGAGKSVQGRKLADELGLPWLSTGEFLRMLISGERRKEMQDGKLLEDKEIISLVRKIFAVVDVNQEFILDGFPRTVGQADWLLGQVKHGQLHITAVIHIKASEDVVTARLMKRGRQDDHADAIAARFKEYREAILPILEEFKNAGTHVYEVDGDRSEAAVYTDILAELTDAKG